MAEPFFGRRKTVWEAVKEQLKPPEVTEVENVIGLQLLNEIESLRQELEGLESMLESVEEESESQAAEGFPIRSQNEEMLHAQIRQFVMELRAVRGEEGLHSMLASPKERAAVEYVCNPEARRPGSSRSWERPSSARPRSAFTSNSAPEEIVKPLGAISALTIERVLRPLRAALNAERAMLEDDIVTTRAALEAVLGEKKPGNASPTTQELKQLKAKLESEVQADTHRASTLQRLTLASAGSLGRNQLAPLGRKPDFSATVLPPRYPLSGAPTPPAGAPSDASPSKHGRKLRTPLQSMSSTLPLPSQKRSLAPAPMLSSSSTESQHSPMPLAPTAAVPMARAEAGTGGAGAAVVPAASPSDAAEDDEKWFRDDFDDVSLGRGVSLGGLALSPSQGNTTSPAASDRPTTASSRARKMRGEIEAARLDALRFLE